MGIASEDRSKPRYSLASISSLPVRNMMRGLLSRKGGETETVDTLNNIRAASSNADSKIVSSLLLHSPLFAHLAFVDDFPRVPRTLSGSSRLASRKIEHELEFQCMRLTRSAEKLVAFVSDLHRLNEALWGGSANSVIAGIERMASEYGLTLVLLRKVAFAARKFPDDEILQMFCGELLAVYGAERRNIISLAASDTIDESFAFVPLRRSMIDFVDGGHSATQADIIRWTFRPIRFSQDDVESQLQSHGLFSVVDSLLFIMTHLQVGAWGDRLNEIIRRIVPSSLVDAWQRTFSMAVPTESLDLGAEPEFRDLSFYRQSIAWIEYQGVCRLRMAVDHLYVDNKDTDGIAATQEYLATQAFFSAADNLSSVVRSTAYSGMVLLDRFDGDAAGMFLRTIAVIYVLRHGHPSDPLSRAQTLLLVNSTANLAMLLSPAEIRRLLGGSSDDLLCRYISDAVVYDCTSAITDGYRLRHTLQELVRSEFGGDLIRFAEFLGQNAKHVAEHLSGLCTEEFLIQLFDLFPTTDEVYEAKARLLEWHSDAFNEQTSRDAAKRLRIDQRLQRVRGEIDDVRIYVDPVRFGIWLQDNTIEELSAALRVGPQVRQLASQFTDFSDLSMARQPHVRLARVLQNAYNEFCADKRYGVDSYIGRRIRHGTLKGFLLTELVPADFPEQLDNPRVAAMLDEWIKRFEANVDSWASERFQVKSRKKPHGLIDPDLTTSGKITQVRSALVDLVDLYDRTKSLATVHQAMFEWCWRFLEDDLKRIRSEIETARSDWGAMTAGYLSRPLKERDDGLRRQLSSVSRQITNEAGERLRAVMKWFTKPTNLAPSAPIALLFDAVVQEVQEYFPDYHPQVIPAAGADMELYGALYQHVYDYFYVVIYNAAKHGHRKGTLRYTLGIDVVTETRQVIAISVASQIADDDSLQAVRERIQSAVAGSLEDAMVVERRSGIKKLLRMKADMKEVVDVRIEYYNNMVDFIFILLVSR